MLAGVALIVVTVFFVYGPALHGGFILDDNILLTDSPLIKASDGLYWFWCSTKPADYWPLSNTSLWIEWRLWGMDPTGYHVTNVLLHIAASLLIWRILRMLSIPGALLGAMLFAVHPVNVESVAWIAQRKDALALPLFLLAILWYVKAERTMPRPAMRQSPPPRDRWYWLSLGAFVAAMLAKGSVAVLPPLLVLIVWWLRPLRKSDVVRVAPFFAVAIGLTLVNLWFQTHGASHAVRKVDFLDRLLGAGGVVWFYLSKAVLPVRLAFIYPQWHIDADNWLWWLPLLAAAAVTAILWPHRNGWPRSLLFAWAFFCVALTPVLGFTDVGFMLYSLVADHYQHIALIAITTLAAAGWGVWRRRTTAATAWLPILLAAATVATLAVLARQQSKIYRDPVALYEATLEYNPDCSFVHNNLGNTLAARGRAAEARQHYLKAVQTAPDNAEAHNNLATALARENQLDEAIVEYQRALTLRPRYNNARLRLAYALIASGRASEAEAEFRETLNFDPSHDQALNGLAWLLATNPDASVRNGVNAVQVAERAVRATGGREPQVLDTLAAAYAEAGRFSEAVAVARKALELATRQNDWALAKELREHLTLFVAGKPYREPVPRHLPQQKLRPAKD
ncbi:MAG: tetratricopeptide repeat protein [Thermoguttaceae bacterium]